MPDPHNPVLGRVVAVRRMCRRIVEVDGRGNADGACRHPPRGWCSAGPDRSSGRRPAAAQLPSAPPPDLGPLPLLPHGPVGAVGQHAGTPQRWWCCWWWLWWWWCVVVLVVVVVGRRAVVRSGRAVVHRRAVLGRRRGVVAPAVQVPEAATSGAAAASAGGPRLLPGGLAWCGGRPGRPRVPPRTARTTGPRRRPRPAQRHPTGAGTADVGPPSGRSPSAGSCRSSARSANADPAATPAPASVMAPTTPMRRMTVETMAYSSMSLNAAPRSVTP